MKVGDVTGRPEVGRSQEATSEKPSVGSRNFSSFLSEEIESGPERPRPADKLDAPAALIAPSMVTSMQEASSCSAELQGVLGDIEAADGRLESIEKTISSPTADLKTVDSMIRVLNKEADQLQQKLSVLPDGHPLRRIGDELNVLAYVESVKWNRGDYL